MGYKEFSALLDRQRNTVELILDWVELLDSGKEISMDSIEFSQLFNKLRNVVVRLNATAEDNDYLLVGYEAKVSRYKLSLYVCNGVGVDHSYTLVIKKK